MRRRKLVITLAATAMFGLVVVPAHAELHSVTVRLVTGEEITVTVDVAEGQTAQTITIPGLPAPVETVTDLGPVETETPTPKPTSTATPERTPEQTATPAPTEAPNVGQLPAPTPGATQTPGPTATPGGKRGGRRQGAGQLPPRPTRARSTRTPSR